MAHRILVVEDDPHIREIVRFALEKAGMRVVTARDGEEAMGRFVEAEPDLVVLDIGLPEIDGLEVCRRIRKTSEAPILFLSARDEEIDRILGLELGADDYVSKPFSPRELVARVRAILKRVRAAPAAQLALVISRGELVMKPQAHEVAFCGRPIALTALEFAILKILMERPNIVFSREQILDAAYGGAIHVADRTIDSHIRNIRGKLAAVGCETGIETVHGVGFRVGRCETVG